MSDRNPTKTAAPEAGVLPSPDENGPPSGAADKPNRRLEMIPPSCLVADKRNARTHSKRQIDQIARSITQFGFIGAVLVDLADQIIAGHGRVEAAKQLGLDQVPVLRVTHLSAAERKAYAIADNRLAELAGWDGEILAIELQELREVDFDIGAIGFELGDVDIVPEKGGSQPAQKPDRGACASGRPVSRAGDVWLLGPHQLRCGDADDEASYAAIDAAIRRWQRAAAKRQVLPAPARALRKWRTNGPALPLQIPFAVKRRPSRRRRDDEAAHERQSRAGRLCCAGRRTCRSRQQ